MKKNLILSLAILISACSSDDTTIISSEIGVVEAVVATIDPGFVSGAHSLVGYSSIGLSSLNALSPSGSDVVVKSFGENYYIIDRSGESITKFAFAKPGEVIWQFTTKNSATDTGSNPHTIVFVNEQKAYLLRYGKTTAWIVNPSATQEADFKTGELDFADYAAVDGDGIPEMDNGIIVNNKLFVSLQMLNTFSPTDTAYVAVFDVTNDQEIDTATSGNTLKGVPLEVRNPFSDIAYSSETGLIYIQAVGDFFTDYSGGIESLDPTDYSTALLLDDGDVISHPYGRISAFAIHSDKIAYFVGLDGYDSEFNSINNLYKINPETGVIELSAIAAMQGIEITAIAIDSLGRLWVSDASNATLHIVDVHTDEVVDAVATVLDPGTVAFAP